MNQRNGKNYVGFVASEHFKSDIKIRRDKTNAIFIATV
jgi:hypothetical protein